MRVKWGIVSTAHINRLFLAGARESPAVEILAVASRDQGRAEQYAYDNGIERAYGNYDALLNDPDIDAVYISLPNSMHVDATVRALEAGKHVLCEKPLSCHTTEVERAFDTAKSNDRLLMEAFMWRHNPQTRRLTELVQQRAVGKIRIIRAAFGFVANDPANVRLSPALDGGALMDVGCYCVSGARLIAGDSQETSARTSTPASRSRVRTCSKSSATRARSGSPTPGTAADPGSTSSASKSPSASRSSPKTRTASRPRTCPRRSAARLNSCSDEKTPSARRERSKRCIRRPTRARQCAYAPDMSPRASAALGEIIRQQRELAELSMRQFAELAGISNPYLSQIERGLRAPSQQVVDGIAKALHSSADVLYEQAGMTRPGEEAADNAVLEAIAADHRLTARQRKALAEIYESFIASSPAGRRTS
jgi:transcriptional regulator with XRE-family HTH domain